MYGTNVTRRNAGAVALAGTLSTCAVVAALLAGLSAGAEERQWTPVGSGAVATSAPIPGAPAVAEPSWTTPHYLAAAAAPEPRRPLMAALDAMGVARYLDQAGIQIYGHAEIGYTWNFENPRNDQNNFRTFDFEHDELNLNQLQLSIERAIDYTQNKFDVGFLVEWMYGADAGLIHANGIFDHYDGPRNPENQFDPTQFYLDLGYGGVRVRLGKFVNLVGYESINPLADYIGFYSRSFIFSSSYPFTHLGGLVTVDPVKDVLSVTAGVTRGDDQGFEDNNDAWSFIGAVKWNLNKQLQLYVANSTGQEQDNNNSDYRTTWDVSLYYTPSRDVRLLGNVYFVYDNAGDPDGGSGYLYAVAFLGSYRLNDFFTVKGRAEFVHDEDGLRFGPRINLYELTVGVDIHPFGNDPWGRNVLVRPEIRYDFSDDDVFNDGQDKSQLTAGVDVILRF